MDNFLSDYSAAKTRAGDVDDLILRSAGNISDPLKDLVSLAARQTMSATELTVANDTHGHWNVSDIKMFMKDLGCSKYASVHAMRLYIYSCNFHIAESIQ